MPMEKQSAHTPGIVSQLPVHHGDGWCWGGDWIVTFGRRSINLGAAGQPLANLLAAAPDLAGELRRVTDHLETWANDHSDERTAEIDAAIYCARAALSRATR